MPTRIIINENNLQTTVMKVKILILIGFFSIFYLKIFNAQSALKGNNVKHLKILMYNVYTVQSSKSVNLQTLAIPNFE